MIGVSLPNSKHMKVFEGFIGECAYVLFWQEADEKIQSHICMLSMDLMTVSS